MNIKDQLESQGANTVYSWAAKKLQEVKGLHKPGSVVERLTPITLKCIGIKPDQCYWNALLIALTVPDVKYVEGFVESPSGHVFPHAWNSLDGKHFDVTNEVLEDHKIEGRYYAVLEMDGEEAEPYNLVNPDWNVMEHKWFIDTMWQWIEDQ